MEDDIDVTPKGETTPKTRIYRDSVDVIDRDKPHQVTRQHVAAGADGTSTTTGIGPVDLVFRGDWVGSEASTLADRLESIIDDETVEQVDLAAVGSTATRYDGTYRLADKQETPQPAPQTDLFWSYELRLVDP